MKHGLGLAILAALWLPVACAAQGELQSHAGHVQTATSGPGYTTADVEFMQNMIGHHDQALIMAALVPTHTASSTIHKAAEKIRISQRDEIEFMQGWLEARGQPLPQGMTMHSMHMPGMLTQEQLEHLNEARGPEFDRLFLEFMIHHHRGALEMVETLLADRGAAQDPEIFRFVTDVDADQRAEIFIMQGMLDMLDTSQGSQTQ